MFNVSPTSFVPGLRVNPLRTEPGFHVEAGQPARFGFADVDGARSANGGVAPIYDPGPGGGGSGWDKCTLMPGIEQFGFCLYLCPDGAVRRIPNRTGLGCQPFIFRNGGLGL